MKYYELCIKLYKYVCYLKDFEMIETSDQKYQPPLTQDSIYSVCLNLNIRNSDMTILSYLILGQDRIDKSGQKKLIWALDPSGIFSQFAIENCLFICRWFIAMSAMLYSLLVCWWVSYVYTCHSIWILGPCRGCSQKYEHYIIIYIYIYILHRSIL